MTTKAIGILTGFEETFWVHFTVETHTKGGHFYLGSVSSLSNSQNIDNLQYFQKLGVILRIFNAVIPQYIVNL